MKSILSLHASIYLNLLICIIYFFNLLICVIYFCNIIIMSCTFGYYEHPDIIICLLISPMILSLILNNVLLVSWLKLFERTKPNSISARYQGRRQSKMAAGSFLCHAVVFAFREQCLTVILTDFHKSIDVS